MAPHKTTIPVPKPIATKTFDVLWLIDMPNGAKQLVVFTSSRSGQKVTETFANAVMAREAAGFCQRHRIVVTKPKGPTGDTYFGYDYRFIGLLEDKEEARGDASPVRPLRQVWRRRQQRRRSAAAARRW